MQVVVIDQETANALENAVNGNLKILSRENTIIDVQYVAPVFCTNKEGDNSVIFSAMIKYVPGHPLGN